MAAKQIIRVLDAVEAGSRTLREISQATGLSYTHASSYLHALKTDGLIFIAKRERLHTGQGGRAAAFYEPVRRKVVA
jgi:DNA-binding IclR family transcriptional regulator